MPTAKKAQSKAKTGAAPARHRVFGMLFAKIYPKWVQKAVRKNRTQKEVDQVICWLTGYTPAGSISSFVRLDTVGANTNLMIDADGAGAGGFVQVATLQGVTGLLLNDLLANQNLLAA